MGGQVTDTTEHDTEATIRLPRDDVDATLRLMGYGRRERERIRRGQPRPRNEAKYRDVTVKRFHYYLARQLPSLTETSLASLVASWVNLTDCDLDLAQRWWAVGIDPSAPGPLVDAIEAGLRVEHLKKVVQGRSVAEHLQAGNSLRWCMGAIGLPTSVNDDREFQRSA